MAENVSTSADILAALKTYYGDQVVESLLFRNSPTLKKIKKLKIGGKQYPLPMVYSRGGAVSADYTQASSQATQNFGAREMMIVPGQLFSPFVINPKEYLSSRTSQGAYMSLLALKAFAALEGMRKTLAKCLFGSGYLEMGKAIAVDATNKIYVTCDTSTAMGLDIGSIVEFSATPGGAARAGGSVQVSAIQDDGATVAVTFASAYGATVAAADYIRLVGGRDSSGYPNAPIGLAEWIPSYYNRTGSSWTSYIATAFFGVDRSIYPTRLAGSFVLRNSGASEKYHEAISRCIRSVRRNGGVPDMIVMNDYDFNYVMNELQASRNFWQAINASGSKKENSITQGLSDMSFQFSTSFLEYVIDDPYCPVGIGYILEEQAVMFLGLSNTDAIIDDRGPAGNDPGAPKASGESEPSTNYQFLIDDYYTTRPVDTTAGTGIQVDFNLYGNFAINAPAHCGVIVF